MSSGDLSSGRDLGYDLRLGLGRDLGLGRGVYRSLLELLREEKCGVCGNCVSVGQNCQANGPVASVKRIQATEERQVR